MRDTYRKKRIKKKKKTGERNEKLFFFVVFMSRLNLERRGEVRRVGPVLLPGQRVPGDAEVTDAVAADAGDRLGAAPSGHDVAETPARPGPACMQNSKSTKGSARDDGRSVATKKRNKRESNGIHRDDDDDGEVGVDGEPQPDPTQPDLTQFNSISRATAYSTQHKAHPLQSPQSNKKKEEKKLGGAGNATQQRQAGVVGLTLPPGTERRRWGSCGFPP